MSTPQQPASVLPVSTDEGRPGPTDPRFGAELRARRDAIGISRRDLADRAGVGRGSIEKIEAGETLRGHYAIVGAIDKALSDLEHEMGMDLPSQVETIKAPTATEPGVVRVRVEGVYGAKSLIVEAPPENVAELEAMVDRIMRNLQQQGEDKDPR